MSNDLPFSTDPLSRRQLLKAGAGVVAGGTLATLLGASGPVASAFASTAKVPTPTVKPTIDGDLNWLTWAEYIPPKVVTSFEKKYGVKVTQSYMTDDEQYVQKLAAGEPFDLITTNSAYLPQSVGGNLLQTFDPSDLKNFHQLIDFYQHPFYDDAQYRYTVPYGYGPTGIAYLSNKVSNVSHTWNDLFDHPEAKGHVYVLDQLEETIGAALLRDGYPLNSGSSAQVQKAVKSLMTLKPDLGGITTNVTPLLTSGQGWLVHAWATNVYEAIEASKTPEDIKFYLPTDGAPVAADTLSIGKNAKSPGTALLFIDWVLQEDNNYALGQYAAQKTGAKGGNAAFDDLVKKYPMFKFDDEKVLSDRGNWKIYPTGSRLSLYNQEWNAFEA